MSYTIAIPKTKLSCPNHPKYVPTLVTQDYHASCRACEAIWGVYAKHKILLPAIHHAQWEISEAKGLRAARKARHER